MATNNAVNKLGEAPIGSIVRYDPDTAPANSGWLEADGSAVSKTTYSQLYSITGNYYEGTGNLTSVDEITAATNKSCFRISWHPSSNYVAAGSDVSGHEVFVASFNGTTLTEVAYANAGSRSFGVSWHPNGNFLAATTVEGHLLKVYGWNGSNSLTEVESIDISYGGNNIDWHPNGNFLAVTHYSGGSDEVSVYSWNGSDTLTQVEAIDYSNSVYVARWSPNGNYLAVGTIVASHQVDIYSWNGSDTLTYICAYDYGAGNYIFSLDWTPDGAFLACGGYNDLKHLVVLSFDGSALTERASKDYGTALLAAVKWSRGGNYLLSSIANTSSTVDSVFLNTWVPSSYTLTQTDTISEVKQGSQDVGWNYTNNYFAYAGYNTDTSPYNILYAGTTGLTSCDYRTNFPLPNIADKLIRAK